MNSKNVKSQDVKISLPENETIKPVQLDQERQRTVVVSYTIQGQVEIQVPHSQLTSDKLKNESLYHQVLTDLSDKELVHNLEGYSSGEIEGDAIVVTDATVVDE